MDFRSLHEECGVFGAIGVENAYDVVMTGLATLQHRGQEGCGIAYTDGKGEIHVDKGPGLVFRVFSSVIPESHPGRSAIGHVRYGTAGGREADNIQPFAFHQHGDDYAIAHNGNIVNAQELKVAMGRREVLFSSSSDSEILAHLIKKSTFSQNDPRIFSIVEALNRLEGAFAFLIMTKNRIYAARDKYGFRPLSLGRLGDGYVVSSETCAFGAVGAEFIRDLEPGEVVTIDHHGLRCRKYSDSMRHAMCAMEYIYFSRPDSDIESRNVHTFRRETGRLLATEAPADADIVVGVPDSSLSAAMGYSDVSGLPYEMGLIKNKYIARTFIQPSQELRDKGVKMKLSPVRSIIAGKRVVLIDDSIVRGTTSLRIVRMLREAGATEVHVRIASPPIKYPCFYGVDISTYDELLCASRTVEQAREAIEADSLAFLSEQALFDAGKRGDLCLACFNGKYPTPLFTAIENANKDGKF